MASENSQTGTALSTSNSRADMTDTAGGNNSRVKKTLLNAKVSFIFYFLTLVTNFIARKYFLEYLGDEFVGLTSTLLNILGYLNLAELGVSSAIAFNLYKPLREGNREKITQIVSLLGYYYRNIGLVVAAAGIVLSGFLYFIFKDSAFTDYGVIYFAFYGYLFFALAGYFINYRQILLVADQKSYVFSSMYQSSVILKSLTQIAIAVWLRNFYLWIATEIVFSVGYCFLLNARISKIYPWLKGSLKEGKIASKNNPEIFKSTKQVFIHKIKDFLLTQSDQLFVFIFVSLKMVAYYGNYVMITSKAMQLFNQLLDSVLAGVGNLVAENDKVKLMRVFWELMAIRYFMAGFLCYAIYHLIDPIIVLWLGEEYLLGNIVVLLLVVNLFIMISRGTVDNFNFAYGHFADTWAAWVELVLNLGVTIVAGYFWGIPGILLGKIVSMLPTIVFWKPYYLFSSGFQEKYSRYWGGTLKYFGVLAVCIIVSEIIIRWMPVDSSGSLLPLIAYAVTLCVVFGCLYLSTIVLFCPGGKTLLQRAIRKI